MPTRRALVVPVVTPEERTSAAAVTAAVSGVLALYDALWRWSASMSQLDDDGLPVFSANDWLAPVLTHVVLAACADLRGPAEPRRFARTRALATIAAPAVTVLTI